MKTSHIIIAFICLLPVLMWSQRSKEKITKLSISLNLNESNESFFRQSNYTIEGDLLYLEYRTPVSGTFELVPGDYKVEKRLSYTPLKQKVGLGFGIQVLKANGMFYEISIPKLSLNEREFKIEYELRQHGDLLDKYIDGFKQNTFELDLRIESGKYFGDYVRNGFKFGLSAAIDAKINLSKYQPLLSVEYGLNGNYISYWGSVSPSLFKKFSKILSLEFKAVPSFFLGKIGDFIEDDPNIAQQFQALPSEVKALDMDLTFALIFRLKINHSKSRSRKLKGF